jgi:hypothetical protein
MCVRPIPYPVIKPKIAVFQYARCATSDLFVSRSLVSSPRDKLHQFHLIFEAKTPKALGYILRGHGATPTILKVTYGDINLLEMVVTTRFRVCRVGLQFADEALKTGMFSYEARCHVKSEMCRDADVVSELTEGFGGILIIT